MFGLAVDSPDACGRSRTGIRKEKVANLDITKSAFQSGKNKSSTNLITCGRVNRDIFESDDIANSCPVSYRTMNQYGGTTAATEHICRHYRALFGACSKHILLQRVAQEP